MLDSRFLYDDVNLKNSTVNSSLDAAIHSASTLRYLLLNGRTRLEPLRIFECRRVRWLDHWVPPPNTLQRTRPGAGRQTRREPRRGVVRGAGGRKPPVQNKGDPERAPLKVVGRG